MARERRNGYDWSRMLQDNSVMRGSRERPRAMKRSNGTGNVLTTGPQTGGINPGAGQWQEGTSETTANEGPCYTYGVFSQQIPVSCDSPICMVGPCGSTTTETPGTGDFYTGPGGTTEGSGSGPGDWEDCEPVVNFLGQCVACCG